MPTVVNDMILEPKAMPPDQQAAPGGGSSGGGGPPPPSPDLARQVKQIERLCHERSMRLCAH
jgi:hypothetical protein